MFKPPVPLHDDPRTYQIIGAALEVHRVLGAGFLELFYKDALFIEFTARRLPFRREVPGSNIKDIRCAVNIAWTSSAPTRS